jgi:hypothetical protein
MPSGQVEHRGARATVFLSQLREVPERIIWWMVQPVVVIRRDVAQLLEAIERQGAEHLFLYGIPSGRSAVREAP